MDVLNESRFYTLYLREREQEREEREKKREKSWFLSRGALDCDLCERRNFTHAIYPLEYNIFEDTRSPGEVKRNSTKTGCIEMLW